MQYMAALPMCVELGLNSGRIQEAIVSTVVSIISDLHRCTQSRDVYLRRCVFVFKGIGVCSPPTVTCQIPHGIQRKERFN